MATIVADTRPSISPRQRVQMALDHREPDRVPVDFLAVPEIWQRLISAYGVEERPDRLSTYFDSAWETVLQILAVDCRVISYDQFCQPPAAIFVPAAGVDWFGSLSRSTPNRMWRQSTPSGDYYDIWGHHTRVVQHPGGAYEEVASYPLGGAISLQEIRAYPWPEPSWWDFKALPDLLAALDQEQEFHIRFRMGSVFETSWQLRGLERFLMDLATAPEIPEYIMERVTGVLVEITRQVLEVAGERIDMLYYYDDVATQKSLMISPRMWDQFIRPHHSRLIDAAKAYGKPVMYHCDGAIYPLIPRLIDLGVDVLNPIQPDARDMDPLRLKNEFGDRLSFHGGIDIVQTLPRGSVKQVKEEVANRIRVLGKQGGYILASSHHIQAETPLENVIAMYDISARNG